MITRPLTGSNVYGLRRALVLAGAESLETTKRSESKRTSLESAKLNPVASDMTGEFSEKELGLTCLDNCLRTLPAESAELILEYYKYERRRQIEQRRALAEQFGLRRDALANRVQRLRDKLQQCVSRCLRKKSAI